MSRVLVTGVGGFTGRHVSDRLVSEGFEVYGTLSNQIAVEGFSQENVKGVYLCPLNDKAALAKTLSVVQPDYVIHLAAISFVAHADLSSMYSVNVIGTENLLEAIYENVKNIRRVIVASSANVYGNNESESIGEDEVFSPINHYAISKVSMEYIVRSYTDRIPLVIARPFNYTGVGQSDKFLVPKIINHFNKKLPFIELGNIDVARDISDVRYVAQAYCGLLKATFIEGEVFNICSGKVVSLSDILKMASYKTGHNIEVNVNPGFIRSNEIKVLGGSDQKLVSVLDNLKKIELEVTLDWMLSG